jgi:hypothetical protein
MVYFKIRFINTSGFVSDAIDWWTSSLWSHAEIETETGTFIGAHSDGGIEERPADYCKPTRERRYSIPCTQAQVDRIMLYARSKIGTKYNFADIVGLLFHDRKLNSSGKDICSVFVLVSAMQGNIHMLNVQEGFTYLVTPEMLHLSPLLIGNCTYEMK